MHGGLSTGPRTAEGLERSRRARWVHGRYSREAIEARRRANWETLEQGVARIMREERRAERVMARQFRAMWREFDRRFRGLRRFGSVGVASPSLAHAVALHFMHYNFGADSQDAKGKARDDRWSDRQAVGNR